MLGLRRWSVVLLLLTAWIAPVVATDFVDSPAARHLITRMVEQDGFERDTVRGWLSRARHSQSVIERISAPAEKVLDWGEYREIFLTRERLRQGKHFMAAHRGALARAEARYGVPASLIAAIIGIETFYGRHKGNDRVLDALATLAFDYPPRSEFFSDELRHFLILAREQGFDPDQPKGSYAGAMGYGQFIPSSYRRYAVDFDGDGAVDLFSSTADAIGSVANYLHEHGWQTGQPVASPLDGEDDGRQDLPGRRLQLRDDDASRYWQVYHNFEVIRRYNHSDLYVMAAWQLAQSLKTGE